MGVCSKQNIQNWDFDFHRQFRLQVYGSHECNFKSSQFTVTPIAWHSDQLSQILFIVQIMSGF